MFNVGLDIETIPTQNVALQNYILESVKAPANYKDPAKIQEYINEARLDALDKLSFDGGFNHIVCIGLKFNDEQSESLMINDVKDESDLIRHAYAKIDEKRGHGFPNFYGHNIINFDMKILAQRSMVLGIKVPVFMPVDLKPWDERVFDTMTRWAGAKDSISMEKLLKIFGIDGKISDGSQVYKMWLAGNFQGIADYNGDEMNKLHMLYKRMTDVK